MIIDTLTKLFEKDPTVKRHLLKTISWRIVGSIDTAILGWIISGQLSIGAKIGSFELMTKMILYFAHERVWHKFHFGIPTRLKTAEQIKKQNAANLFLQKSKVSRTQREELNENRSFTVWLTGLSASGKSTIATELDAWFYQNGMHSYVVDGDNTRLGINSDLTFTKEDRSENIRRVAEICKLFNNAGVIAIASFISPFADDRLMAEEIIGEKDFIEVFVDADIETCKARDIKGLYKMAEKGKLKNFTGIGSPYEVPLTPDVHLNTNHNTPDNCVELLVNFLKEKKLLKKNFFTDQMIQVAK